MKANGDYELSDVPSLRAAGEPHFLMGARTALVDAADQIVTSVGREGRAMRPDEQRAFDEYAGQVMDINDELAEFKRLRIANNNSGLPVILPF